jgi:hypothetical protein
LYNFLKINELDTGDTGTFDFCEFLTFIAREYNKQQFLNEDESAIENFYKELFHEFDR